MYIRRTLSKSGKRRKKYYTYRIVETYRIKDKVRQRTLLSLGSDFSLPQDRWAELTQRIEDIISNRPSLLDIDSDIETLAQSYSAKIIEKQGLRTGEDETSGAISYIPVNIDAIETLQSKSIGGERVLYETIKQLKLPSLFSKLGLSDKQQKSITGLLIAKALAPGSERSMLEWLRYNSAAGELIECDYDAISLSSLYRSTDLLRSFKQSIESYLYEQQKSLLGFEESITLFDLTNTYFEGEANSIDKAHRGRSKEKRSDAPLVTLAVVLDGSGAIRHSDIYEGNISEASTFTQTIKALDDDTHKKEPHSLIPDTKPVVVMDAGIATEANVQWLIENQYRYIVVSRKRNKQFDEASSEIVKTYTKNSQKIEVKAQKIINEEGEVELYCRSEARSAKEKAMFENSQRRFIEEIEKLKEGLHIKRRTKAYDKVLTKIGRLRERNSYSAQRYDIEVKADNDKKLAVDITIKEKKDIHNEALHYGIYCLRSNLIALDEETLWRTYITLTDLEAVFRSLKSELGLRPIYHRKGERVDAHIILTLMAYTLIHTVRIQLKAKGINESWESIRKTLSSLRRSTMILPTLDGVIHQRQNDTAQARHRRYLDALGISFPKMMTRIEVETGQM